jgi:hypothetical protein
MHAIGHVAANVSFAAVAISLTHTVKTLEPAFNVILSQLILGESTPLPVVLTLVPIMVRGCTVGRPHGAEEPEPVGLGDSAAARGRGPVAHMPHGGTHAAGLQAHTPQTRASQGPPAPWRARSSFAHARP